MNAIRLYARYIGVSIRSQMEYRASFAMQTLAHFLLTGIDFVALWALFERFDTIQGWSLYEVCVFYGMISVAFAINDALTRGFDRFPHLLKQGDFDRYLLRPRSTLLQLFGYELRLTRFGRFAQAWIVLLFGLRHLDIPLTLPKLALIAWTMFGAVCLFMGLLLLQATFAFWTTESLEIMNTLTYGGIETAQYPLAIYHEWFRKFFTFLVPLGCVNYFPLLLLLNRYDPARDPAWLYALSPAAGIAFLFAGVLAWRVGLRHYASTGS